MVSGIDLRPLALLPAYYLASVSPFCSFSLEHLWRLSPYSRRSLFRATAFLVTTSNASDQTWTRTFLCYWLGELGCLNNGESWACICSVCCELWRRREAEGRKHDWETALWHGSSTLGWSSVTLGTQEPIVNYRAESVVRSALRGS